MNDNIGYDTRIVVNAPVRHVSSLILLKFSLFARKPNRRRRVFQLSHSFELLYFILLFETLENLNK